eukprot:TRINITY_DN7400_c0_g1_i2.p1 TRINITY_DN7400_c0_g1~~TRINITY_DN7400_c0_g1_i2.p1  ORF type:complete len:1663 (-),score=433.08 TRINITY_DN7400_c0_g1_i2:46-5034(-)
MVLSCPFSEKAQPIFDTALTSICALALALFSSNRTAVEAFISTSANKHAMSPSPAIRAQSALLLGRLARTLDDPEITDSVAAVLANSASMSAENSADDGTRGRWADRSSVTSFPSPDEALKSVATPEHTMRSSSFAELGRVASLGNASQFESTLSMLSAVFLENASPAVLNASNQTIVLHSIPNALSTMAEGVEEESKLREILGRVVLLGMQVGATVNRLWTQTNVSEGPLSPLRFTLSRVVAPSATSSSAILPTDLSFRFSALLPVISRILARLTPAALGQLLEKRLRSLWLFCVHFGYAHTHPEIVRPLAAQMPAFTSSHLEEIFEEVRDFSTRHVADANMTTLRERFSIYVPGLAQKIKPLPDHKLLYTLSVFELEKLRVSVQPHRFDSCLLYLESDEICDDSALGPLYAALLPYVFECMCVSVRDGLSVSATHQHLSLQAQLLTLAAASRSATVRQEALYFLGRLLHEFPQVLWEADVVAMFLNLIHLISTSLRHDFEVPGMALAVPAGLTSISSKYLSTDLSTNSIIISLPEELAIREEIVAQLRDLCRRWYSYAHSVAPMETQSALQQYVLHLQHTNAPFSADGRTSHLGYFSALELASSLTAVSAVPAPVSSSILGGSSAPASSSTPALSPPAATPAILPPPPLSPSLTAVSARELPDSASMHFSPSVHTMASSTHPQRSPPSSPTLSAQQAAQRGPTAHRAPPPTSVLAPPGSAVAVNRQDSQLAKERASMFVNGLEWKSRYSGQHQTVRESLSEATQAAEKTIAAIADLVARFSRTQTVHIPTFRDYLSRSASLIIAISEPSSDSKNVTSVCVSLIESVVTAPFNMFSPEALESGVFVWSWILAARPKFSALLLTKIAVAWKLSIQEKKGMFDGYGLNGMKNPWTVEQPQQTELYAICPHSIILGWLTERFEINKRCSIEETAILTDLVHYTSANSAHISLRPSASISRFRLIVLGFSLLHAGCIRDEMSFRILRVRLFQFAYAHFSRSPLWFSPSESSMVIDYLQVLVSFCTHLSQKHDAFGHVRRILAKENKVAPVVKKNCDKCLSPCDGICNGTPIETERSLLLLLAGCEISRVISWNSPLDPNKYGPESRRFVPDLKRISAAELKQYILTAWAAAPSLMLHLPEWCPAVPWPMSDIENLAASDPLALIDDPAAAVFLATPSNSRSNAPCLESLSLLAPCSLPTAFSLLNNPELFSNSTILAYALRSVESTDPSILAKFVMQMVQLLRTGAAAGVSDRLAVIAKQSDIFAHQLLWNVGSVLESDPEENSTPFHVTVLKLKERVLQEMSDESRQFYTDEFGFFAKIQAISGILKPLPADQRKDAIIRELKTINLPSTRLYLPTNPESRVLQLRTDNPIALKSHARVPIMVSFRCEKSTLQHHTKENEPYSQACIFKVADDVRQDVLATQLIELFKKIFQEASLDVYVAPYKVLATGNRCGMIEVVPNSSSRDSLGKNSDGALYSHFLAKYGNKDSIRFAVARNNFIKSMAAYSILCYILQAKDRHNGNILITDEGHIVHIDFGFMFDISPGGNLRFERAPFKLALEYVEVMGGSVTSPHFRRYAELTIKAFLAIRPYRMQIIAIIQMMVAAKLPCFKPPSLRNLEARFVPEKNDEDASQYVLQLISQSHGKYLTYVYDQFQAWQNDIDYAR